MEVWVYAFRFQCLVFMVEFVGSRVQGVGVRVHGLGFRVWGVFLQKGEGNLMVDRESNFRVLKRLRVQYLELEY